MGTMNGSAARRATAAPPPQWEPPMELHARSWTDEHARSVFHARKWRTQGGLARQSAYAVIDMLLVCGNAFLDLRIAFWLLQQLERRRSPETGDWPHFSASLSELSDSLLLAHFSGLHQPGPLSDPARVEHPAGIHSRRQSRRTGHRASGALHLYLRKQGNLQTRRGPCGVANVFTLSGWRYAKRRLVLHRAEKGQGQSRALVIGAGKMGQAFASWLQHNRHLGYDFCGFLDPHPNGDKRVLGDLSEFRRVALAQFVDEVFITLPSDAQMIKQLFLEARDLRLDLHVLPDLYDGLAWRAPLHMMAAFQLWSFTASQSPQSGSPSSA